MKKIWCFFIFLLATYTGRAATGDSVNASQIALDYFIARLDSLDLEALPSGKFNAAKDKIWYSGKTELFEDLVLGNFKTYTFKKKKFINAGSFDERNRLLTCDKTPQKLSGNTPFVVKKENVTPEERKDGDLLIAVSNPYFYDNFYYVRIRIDAGIDHVQTFFYVKIDPQGIPLTWVISSDITE